MFHFKLYQYPNALTQTYTFPKRGDGLRMHDHPECDKHNVVVMKGSIEIYGPEKQWSKRLTAGEVMDLHDEHHPHEIAALEDGTIIMGMFINGRPQHLPAELTAEDIEGTIERPLVYPLEG
jgi:hypothetical protein